MCTHLSRRDFVRLAAVLPAAFAFKPTFAAMTSAPLSRGADVLEPFEYSGVRLRKSRWLDQYQQARDYYLGVSNDDILHGYRVRAGLPAPGKTLGGWASRNSDVVFGQWLSGMARMYRATGDDAMRDKATYLLAEWAKTIKPDGDCYMGLYGYEKLVCGLVDLKLYADVPAAVPLLEKTMGWAMRTFSPERHAATVDHINGQPGEWYTMPENVYRAFELTGNEDFKRFADTYLYHSFWGKFADTDSPKDAYHVHAYSHVNTFSSAAMAYRITGDPAYLAIVRHAYDYLQRTQCFATGGYGPMERWVPPDGMLGRSIETRNASFETVCGSWAGFKMARYLTRFTGEARYGDWMERLVYNGVGSALPIVTGGKHTYYSDYRVTGGMKVYKVSRYSCCSGSLAQALTDYHNLIYYRDASNLYVNLYMPSEVTWAGPDGEVKLTQDTDYPARETTSLSLEMQQPSRFGLKFRVPEWTTTPTVKLNGADVAVDARPGNWASIDRTWNSGDKVEIRIPMALKMSPVDPQHPRRVAVVRGPAVLVMDDFMFEDQPRLPEPADLDKWLTAEKPRRSGRGASQTVTPATPGVFDINDLDGKHLGAQFRPFYAVGEVTPYRMYLDLDAPTYAVW